MEDELREALAMCAKLEVEIAVLRKQKAEAEEKAKALFEVLHKEKGVESFTDGRMRVRYASSVEITDAEALHYLRPDLVETRVVTVYNPDKTRVRAILESSPQAFDGIAFIRRYPVVEKETRTSVVGKGQDS